MAGVCVLTSPTRSTGGRPTIRRSSFRITDRSSRGAFAGARCRRRRRLASDRARAKPAAADVMADALSLRAEIWNIADALREHQRADLSFINALVAPLPPQSRLLEKNGIYLHDLPSDDLRAPLWPVLWSLTAVLTSTDATRIGCCHAKGCGWFYVDESASRTRMWCSSEVCGNRERARRAYVKRSKQSARPAR